jgi:hypothetical protein
VNVHDVVLQVLRRLPKRAQAVNLGACKGRFNLGLLNVKCACSLFGLDSFTLASTLAAKPHSMLVADLLASDFKGKDNEEGGGEGLNNSTGVGDSGGSNGRRRTKQRRLGDKNTERTQPASSLRRLTSPSQLSSKTIELYRGFGTCRQAYAVTPAGARWMMEVLLDRALASSKDVDFLGMRRKNAGDAAIARSAVMDYRSHQTYFARLFTQAEWENCG